MRGLISVSLGIEKYNGNKICNAEKLKKNFTVILLFVANLSMKSQMRAHISLFENINRLNNYLIAMTFEFL